MGSAFIMGPKRLAVQPSSHNQGAPLGRATLRIRKQSRLSRGLLLCWVDQGNGRYLNVCNGYRVLPGNYAQGIYPLAATGTAFGGATLWPGATLGGGFLEPGPAAIFYGTGDNNPYIGDPRVYALTNLSTLPAGASNTFFCAYIKLGACTASMPWIWGRTGISAGEPPSQQFAVWSFIDGLSPNSDGTVSCYVLNNSGAFGAQQAFGSFNVTARVFNTFVCATRNTTSGSGTSFFYANGALNAMQGSIAMWNPNPGNTSETQAQIGGTCHYDTSETQNCVNGIIPIAGFTSAFWNASDAAFFHKRPFDMIAGS